LTPSPIQQGCIAWFTGLSAAGKTTLASDLAAALADLRVPHRLLDGDQLRATLSKGLGFSREGREENLRRIFALALTHAQQGEVVLVAAIAPYRSIRQQMRVSSPVPFFEVFVDAPLAVCEKRDPKGLYQRARAGELKSFTGIDDPYEPPLAPHLRCRTDLEAVDHCRTRLLTLLAPWTGTEIPNPDA
jgi:adenylylsulfate kinase